MNCGCSYGPYTTVLGFHPTVLDPPPQKLGGPSQLRNDNAYTPEHLATMQSYLIDNYSLTSLVLHCPLKLRQPSHFADPHRVGPLKLKLQDNAPSG